MAVRKGAIVTGDEAADRVSFQLTYRRHRTKRRFTSDGITSEQIADAYRRGRYSPGEWIHGFPSNWEADEGWVQWFFRAAISEAVHEALEWFQVDGEPLVNPHGAMKREAAIFGICERFADELYALAPVRSGSSSTSEGDVQDG